MWRKGNPYALLLGMQIGAAIVENGMKFPEKITSRTTIQYNNSTSGHLSEENKNTNSGRYMYPMSFAALFTIAKIWKRPKSPLMDKQIKKMWYIYSIDCYSAIKKNEILSFVTIWMTSRTLC